MFFFNGVIWLKCNLIYRMEPVIYLNLSTQWVHLFSGPAVVQAHIVAEINAVNTQ